MPSPCLLCGAQAEAGLESTQLCSGCVSDMPELASVCQICAEPTPLPDGICHHCEEQTPAFDSVLSAFRYAWPLNVLVTGFKFDGKYAWGDSLTKLMIRRLQQTASAADLESIDLIVPTPLHPLRLKERGYNQAEVLATGLAEAFDLRLDTGLLQRTVNTAAQSGKNRRQRLENLSGAFTVSRELDGENVVVIDDVLTTGVTADRMAMALVNAGASSVRIWVLARTANEL